jgi:hypothetical protein
MAAKKDLAQTIVDTLFEKGALSAQELMAQTGADGPTIAPVVKGLKESGYVVQDGNTFDLADQYKAGAEEEGQTDETDAAFGEPVVEYEEGQQPAPSVAPKPTAAKGGAAKGAAKGGTKAGAKAPTASAGPSVQAPAAGKGAAKAGQKAQKQEENDEFNDVFDMTFDAMDTLTEEELIERINHVGACARANFDTGNYSNQLGAEAMCRWLRKAVRRVRGLRKGTMTVRAKPAAK